MRIKSKSLLVSSKEEQSMNRKNLIIIFTACTLVILTGTAAYAHTNSSTIYPGIAYPRPVLSSDYAYWREKGEKDCAVPPLNYDPLTLTPEQVAYYGFPARPTNANQINYWVSHVSGITYRSCSVTVDKSISTGAMTNNP
jgi:hypothetical protein